MASVTSSGAAQQNQLAAANCSDKLPTLSLAARQRGF
jgi:hypothetical protein